MPGTGESTLWRHDGKLSETELEPVLEWIGARATEPLNYFWLGRQSYRPVWELQKRIHRRRIAGKLPNLVLLLEHEPVYTFGKNADHNHLLESRPGDAEIVQVDRGGDVTYHGPGQLVGYPILDIHQYRLSVSWYMRTLEQVIIDTLAAIGIRAGMKEGLIGVWVEDEKICALGVRLAKWVTLHGFALNIQPDMRYFEGMIPCGIFEYGVTSVNALTGEKYAVEELAGRVAANIHRLFSAKGNPQTTQL